ncbi:MAG TPA: DUF6644 family protein [Bryobacteraceae bacterium]|nr:DUF6644 family protein [Bryobacteraceae bacterium]
MFLLRICEWLDGTPWSAMMRHSNWAFPALDVIHTLGIVLVAGTILLVDLRLMGVGLRGVTIQRLVARIVPATLWGFLLMLASGALLFSTEAVKMYRSDLFRVKMILILMAGLNALIFHRTVYRDTAGWDPAAAPVRAKLAGLLSLIFWIAIIAAGRAIAYAPGYDLN